MKDSRRIKLSYDDRLYFPKLVFDSSNKYISLRVVNSSNHEFIKNLEEIIELSDDMEYAHNLTVLAASSSVECISKTNYR